VITLKPAEHVLQQVCCPFISPLSPDPVFHGEIRGQEDVKKLISAAERIGRRRKLLPDALGATAGMSAYIWVQKLK
jgi:hypothetical protein